MVDIAAGRIEPWEVHHDQGYIVLAVTPAEYLWLQELGFSLVVDALLTAELQGPSSYLPNQVDGIPGYPCYRTVEETYTSAQQIASNYPKLASWVDIGDSWKRTEFGTDSGSDMLVLRLTNADMPGPKPVLLIVSSIHAREYAPAELSMRFAEHLVSQYGLDADITYLLDYNAIHLLIQGNPDGRERAEAGLAWRKNANNNYCSNTNSRGADLNRNFDFRWGCCGGSSSNVCDETYRGASAASEPETQAIQDYMLAVFPDQREDDLDAPAPSGASGVFLDIHSYGRLVLWPWGFTRSQPPNSAALRTLGRKFAYMNEYEPDQSPELYLTDGTTDDFSYGVLGVASYTFELGTAFFQNCSAFESTIYQDNLSALLYAAKVARTPYLSPAGPDSLNAVISPTLVVEGQLATLTFSANDTRYYDPDGSEATQNIARAEFYLDSPPWVTSTLPISGTLAAMDGALDEKIEGMSALVDTGSLAPGKRLVFIRAQDAAGNWGPFSAVFLTVLERQAFIPFTINNR